MRYNNSKDNFSRYLHTFQDDSSFSFAGTTEWGPTHGDELTYMWIMPRFVKAQIDDFLWLNEKFQDALTDF